MANHSAPATRQERQDEPLPPVQDPRGARFLALKVLPMPRDTNPWGTVFGGFIISHVDQAGLVAALRWGPHRWVTASIERVDFRAPVFLGDVITLWASTVRVGRTSVTIRIEVEAERNARSDPPYDAPVPVTAATITMVALSPDGLPIAFTEPATLPPTDSRLPR